MAIPEPSDNVGFWDTVKHYTLDQVWPPDDEHDAWDLAKEWRAVAKLMADAATGIEAQAKVSETVWMDDAGASFAYALRHLPANFRLMADNMRVLADGMDDYGNQLREARINIVMELVANIAIFAALAWLPGGGFLASNIARVVADRLTTMIGQMVGRTLAGALPRALEMGADTAIEMGKEAIDETLINAATQLTSMAMGTRDNFDFNQLGQNALAGAIGGPIGQVLGKATAPLTRATNAGLSRVMPNGLARNLTAGISSAGNNALTSPTAGYIAQNINNLSALTDVNGYAESIKQNAISSAIVGAPRSMVVDGVQQMHSGAQFGGHTPPASGTVSTPELRGGEPGGGSGQPDGNAAQSGGTPPAGKPGEGGTGNAGAPQTGSAGGGAQTGGAQTGGTQAGGAGGAQTGGGPAGGAQTGTGTGGAQTGGTQAGGAGGAQTGGGSAGGTQAGAGTGGAQTGGAGGAGGGPAGSTQTGTGTGGAQTGAGNSGAHTGGTQAGEAGSTQTGSGNTQTGGTPAGGTPAGGAQTGGAQTGSGTGGAQTGAGSGGAQTGGTQTGSGTGGAQTGGAQAGEAGGHLAGGTQAGTGAGAGGAQAGAQTGGTQSSTHTGGTQTSGQQTGEAASHTGGPQTGGESGNQTGSAQPSGEAGGSHQGGTQSGDPGASQSTGQSGNGESSTTGNAPAAGDPGQSHSSSGTQSSAGGNTNVGGPDPGATQSNAGNQGAGVNQTVVPTGTTPVGAAPAQTASTGPTHTSSVGNAGAQTSGVTGQSSGSQSGASQPASSAGRSSSTGTQSSTEPGKAGGGTQSNGPSQTGGTGPRTTGANQSGNSNSESTGTSGAGVQQPGTGAQPSTKKPTTTGGALAASSAAAATSAAAAEASTTPASGQGQATAKPTRVKVSAPAPASAPSGTDTNPPSGSTQQNAGPGPAAGSPVQEVSVDKIRKDIQRANQRGRNADRAAKEALDAAEKARDAARKSLDEGTEAAAREASDAVKKAAKKAIMAENKAYIADTAATNAEETAEKAANQTDSLVSEKDIQRARDAAARARQAAEKALDAAVEAAEAATPANSPTPAATNPTTPPTHATPTAPTNPTSATNPTSTTPNAPTPAATNPTTSPTHATPTAPTNATPPHSSPPSPTPTPAAPTSTTPSAVTNPLTPPTTTPNPPTPTATNPTATPTPAATPAAPTAPTNTTTTNPTSTPNPPTPTGTNPAATPATTTIAANPTPQSPTAPTGPATPATPTTGTPSPSSGTPSAPNPPGVPGPRSRVESVRALAHSRFGVADNADSNKAEVAQRARDVITRVADDAGVRSIDPVPGDVKRFTVTRADGTTFVVRVVSKSTGDNNLAKIVHNGGDKFEIRVSPRAGLDVVERTMANAVAQANAMMNGAPTTNLLDGTTHPGSNTTLSAADQGRQAEVRNLDRAARETSRLRVLRRRRIAGEMRTLVEHLGVHPDDTVGPQRRAVSDVEDIVDKHVKEGDRRPAWALPPDGYPKWRVFIRYHLPAEVLPGTAASALIATVAGAPMVGAGTFVATVTTSVTGTLIKHWYDKRQKTNVDTGHGDRIKIRARESGLRYKALHDPLLDRLNVNNTPGPVPAEPPAQLTRPPIHQRWLARLLHRGGPSVAGAAAATTLIPAGFPIWNAVALGGVATISSVVGPIVDRYLGSHVVSQEWARLDNVGREKDQKALEFDEYNAKRLSALVDRVENLAGIAPRGTVKIADIVRKMSITKMQMRRFGANQAEQFGNLARAGADSTGKILGEKAAKGYVTDATWNVAFDSLKTGALRSAMGMVINAYLDAKFTAKEYEEIVTQVHHDFGNKMAEQVETQQRAFDAMLDELTAKVEEAEAANRVNTSLNSRIAHAMAHPARPPTPPVKRAEADRPAGHQQRPAFRALHLKQAAGMEVVMVGAAMTFNQGVIPIYIIGGVAVAVAGTFNLRYLFRRSGQLAVDETIMADRGRERVVENEEAEARQRFDTEFYLRKLDAFVNGPTTPSTPPAPAPDPNPDLDLANRSDALVTQEREAMFTEPRPWTTLNQRLVTLDRLNRLAQRVRDFVQHKVDTGDGKPVEQASKELHEMVEAYKKLKDDGTPMPDDYEQLKPQGMRGGEPGTRPAGDLQSYVDNSVVTQTGRAYYAQGEMPPTAYLLPPAPGQYTIDMHGGPDFVRIGSDRLTAGDLATLIRADPNWHGEPIRLVACQTGQDADGFAQQLADQLRVTVHAPPDYVGVALDGTLYVTTLEVNEAGIVVPAMPPTGRMYTFEPTVMSGDNAAPTPPAGHVGMYWPDHGDVKFGEMREVTPAEELGELTVMREGPTVYTGADQLWPDELADVVADNGDWAGGPTRLQVRDGHVDPEFGQRLADLLGVPVVVPNNAVAGEVPTLSSGTLEVYNEKSAEPPVGCRVYEPRTVRA